jgi:predicted NUDIX family NTP pyrophosphohydrolase
VKASASAKQRVSAGLLMYRFRNDQLEIFLAHPGGPFFANRDDDVWSIPKGVPNDGEMLEQTAEREFYEEVGLKPHGPYLPLGSITQKGGKVVYAWAFEGDWVEGTPNRCNTFEIEWPPKSGKICTFKEIDKVGFFTLEEARKKLKAAQWPLVERLVQELG